MTEKQKAYYASYYEANKEKNDKLGKKTYNKGHKNEIAEKQRKYYLNNKEKFKIKGE